MTPPTLTPDQRHALRIRIAEWDGLKLGGNNPNCPCHGKPRTCALHVYHLADDRCECTCDVAPNYPTDRNAIVEAVLRRFVTGAERINFLYAMREVLNLESINNPTDLAFALATASAEALCLAYEAAMVGGKETL